jgi:tyrosinase
MLFSSATVAFLASSLVAAKPTPVDTHVFARDVQADMDQIAALAQAAYDQAGEEASTVEKRDNTCSWSNVKIRREW